MEQRLGLDEWDSEVAFTIKYLLFQDCMADQHVDAKSDRNVRWVTQY